MVAAGASSARSGCVGGYVHLSVDPLVGVCVFVRACVSPFLHAPSDHAGISADVRSSV